MTITFNSPSVTESAEGSSFGSHGVPDDRSVISRAFMVLSALDDGVSNVSLARLAERTGLPKGSLHRLCAQLVAQGAVERTNLGYRLGFRMLELGSQAPSPRRLRELALPVMSELHMATKCAIHLNVLSGSDIFVVNSVTGRASMALALPPGGRHRAIGTATGNALLAYASPEVRERALDSVGCPPELRDQLTRIAGGEVSRLWTGQRLQALALPVLDQTGHSIAAVSICWHSFPPRHQHIVDALRGGIASIQQKLRETPGSTWH